MAKRLWRCEICGSESIQPRGVTEVWCPGYKGNGHGKYKNRNVKSYAMDLIGEIDSGLTLESTTRSKGRRTVM